MFFTPAFSAEEALNEARKSVQDAQIIDSTLEDPFDEIKELEVRIGTFDPNDPTKIIYEEWRLIQP